MFAFIRRHQVWGVLFIGIVIISFVVFFSPTASLPEAEVDLGSIKGKPISREDYNNAMRETMLLYFMNQGQWPSGNEAGLERQAYQRLFLSEKLKEYRIDVTPEAAAKWIREIFAGPNGAFSINDYNNFVNNNLRPNGLSGRDLERLARNEVGQQHLISIIGLSGRLVPPQEAEAIYRKQNQPMQTEVALFSASNYLAQVKVDTNEVARYFTNNMAEYRIPDRVTVRYVRFDATNFLSEAATEMEKNTNLVQILEAEYEQRGSGSFTNKEGKPLAKEAALEQLKKEQQERYGLFLARNKAMDFINEVYERIDKGEKGTNAFMNLAKEKDLVVRRTFPFNQQTGPKLDVPPTFAQEAFRLTEEEAVAQRPILGKDAVYAISLRQRFPSRIPPFEQVKEKVTEDYKQAQARELAQKAAESFLTAVTNGVAKGKSFSQVAAETKATLVTPPPFSQSTMDLSQIDPRLSLSYLKQAASELQPGAVSGFNPTPEGGFVVHLKAKLPVDEAKMKEEFPAFLERMRDTRQAAAFGEWFQQQAQQELSLPKTRESES